VIPSRYCFLIIFQDGSGLPFIYAFVLCLITGLLIWYPNRDSAKILERKKGFFNCRIVLTVLASFGAITVILLLETTENECNVTRFLRHFPA